MSLSLFDLLYSAHSAAVCVYIEIHRRT